MIFCSDHIMEKYCRWCGGLFTPFKTTAVVCSLGCAINANADRVKKKAEKEAGKVWNKEKKVMKEKLKTLGEYEKDARKIFQLWIRQRDKDRPCISCGVFKTPQFDAGHYFNAGQFSGLIFEEINCHKQCSVCNDFKGGNLLEYREGLIKRYGESYLKELEAKKETGRNYKYTKQELIEIKNKYKQRLKNKL